MPNNKLDEFYIKLGENVRHHRDKRKLKQETVAAHLGKSRITISNIESGRQRIQLHSLVILARYLQTTIEELLPSLEQVDIDSLNKFEKKIANTEISHNPESVDIVKEFILRSKSRTTP